jgi:hypothetical protein
MTEPVIDPEVVWAQAELDIEKMTMSAAIA